MAVLIFYSYFLLMSSIFKVTLSEGKPCELKVFEEESTQPIEGLCLEEFHSPDCRPFLENFNRSALPKGFDLAEDDASVQRPESLDLTSKMSPYNNSQSQNFLYPGMFVDWSSPVAKNSRQSIKGYLMIWKTSTKSYCRLFKFDTTKKDLLKKKLRFKYEVTFLDGNTHYEVQAYSMPPPEDFEESKEESTFVSMRLTTGSVIEGYLNPARWRPSLAPHVPKDGTLEVKIAYSPKEFNLTEFEVMLVKRSYDENNPFRKVNRTQRVDPQSAFEIVSFKNLTTDEYKIVVHVIDPYRKVVGKCRCWEMETNGRYCRNTCGSVQTRYINVTGDARVGTTLPGPVDTTTINHGISHGPGTVKKSVSPNGGDSNATDIGLILGVGVTVAAAVIILVVVAVILYKRRELKRKGSDGENPN